QKARSATAIRSSAACCDLSPVSQAAPDLQEEHGCVRSCPYRQPRILTPIWESSDASGTLVMLGYVAKAPNSRKFRLTLKPLELGFNAIARMDLRDLARPLLRSLVGSVNEAASLGVIEETEVVY